VKRAFIILLLFFSLPAFGQYDIFGQYNNPFNIWGSKSKSGFRYDSDALAYFARMDKKPADDTLKYLNEFIDSLKKNGTYAKLDRIVITGLNTVYNATLDIKGGTGATLINSPIFTPYKGITTDNGKYIKTEFIPVDSASHNYRMNSGFMGVWNNSTISGVTYR
jgi:hypothetical protein